MPTISTRLRASVMSDSSKVGLKYSLTRDIQGLQQEEDAWNGLYARGVLPGAPAIAAVSGATVKVPAGFRLFSDGVLYTVAADTNFTPADVSATIWLWGKLGVTRATAANYADEDAYSLTLQRTTGASPLPPDGYTTVTTGAASATQLVGSTSGMAAGDALYFAGAGAVRFVASVTDGTHVVLTATVTTTNGEAVQKVGASAWMLLASWATDGSGNVSGTVDANPSAPALMPGKWLHGPNQFGWRAIAVAGAAGTHTLSPAEARDSLHRYTGALTGNRVIEAPFEAGRFYLVRNATSGTFSLTLRVPGGTGGAIPQGETRFAYVDGSDVVVLGAGELGASVAGQYLTLATDADLTSERVLTPGASLQGTDAGAGAAYTLDVKGNAGTPEGVVTAAVGTLCRDTTNGDLYVKHTGAGNTGWRRLLESAETAGGDLTGTFPSPSVATAFPRWVKVTKLFSDLAAAALTNDIEVYSLPAGGVIHGVKIKHSAAFTGGAIASYTLSVGITGTLAKYASAFSVFSAPSNTNFQVSATIGSENHGAATSIRLAAIATGANLDQATAGSADIFILVSIAT